MTRTKNILLLEEMTSAFMQVREEGLGKNIKLHFRMKSIKKYSNIPEAAGGSLEEIKRGFRSEAGGGLERPHHS